MIQQHNTKKILIACEQSQVVCAAFRCLGLTAFSNDILPSYGGHPEWHIIGDAAQVICGGEFITETGASVFIDKWDLMIAHPPCTMLTHSSAPALSQGKHTLEDIKNARTFFLTLLHAPVTHIAIENPAPMAIAKLPRYSQILQPYNFGHRYSKRICLWLVNLPPLIPMRGYYTKHVQWVKHCAGNARRRSRTFEGIAEAMAAQWSAML